jgi:hypothetical protein
MFSNNYKAIFELLGNNEKSNSFEEVSEEDAAVRQSQENELKQ